ncbi:MAG: hypothetical protein JXP34_14640 [Planctomycetes bacterium]|nr:hypothetical protein [Planctomycetota bacterium]
MRRAIWGGGIALIFSAIAGCAKGGGGSPAPAYGPEVSVSGLVTYEKRVLDPLRGLRLAATLTPLPDMVVELIDESSRQVIATARTDDAGRYETNVQSGRRFRAICSAEVSVDGFSLSVLDDSNQGAVWAATSDVIEANAGQAADADIRASATAPDGPAGAFHIALVLRAAAEKVRVMNGGAFPPLPLRAYWRYGNSGLLGTTYYDPEGDAIWILGGAENHDYDSDTDHFDEGVIAHEFGHVLARHFSRDDSQGGLHNGGNLNPFLAYSEGLANCFSSLLREDPLYVDTYGYGPWGGLLISFDVEDWSPGQQFTKGIGSEESVTKVLWDLTDAPASDDDPLAIEPAGVWSVLTTYVRARPFVCVFDVFEGCRILGIAPQADLAALLAPEEIPFPPLPEEQWPWVLSLPGHAERRIDALGSWPQNVTNSFDSAHFYEVILDAPRRLVATLTIDGTGSTPEDLDLFLYAETPPGSSSARLQKSDLTNAPVERIEAVLPAGTYLLEVRGYHISGLREIGQQADYSLDVEVR